MEFFVGLGDHVDALLVCVEVSQVVYGPAPVFFVNGGVCVLFGSFGVVVDCGQLGVLLVRREP